MGLEANTITSFSQLDATWPLSGDPRAEGDDHLRNIKRVLKTTFPNCNGVVSATAAELSFVAGVTSALQTQLNAKAGTASPTFTGTAAFASLSSSANCNLTALDVSGTATLSADTSIGGVSAVEMQYLASVSSNVQTQLDAKAPLNSPVFTGGPQCPTPAITIDSTAMATTGFVNNVAASMYVPSAGTGENSVGGSFSAVNDSAGVYTITHPYGALLTAGNMAISAQAISTEALSGTYVLHAQVITPGETTNTFVVKIYKITSGSASLSLVNAAFTVIIRYIP